MVTEPSSMNECIYFTYRLLDNDGMIKAWAKRKQCPKCKKAEMGKPKDPKTGKTKIRAAEYTCPECGYTEQKTEHEESLTLEAKYKCPYCKKEGTSAAPYIRKSFQGVKAYVVECEHCHEKIPLTQKMKEPKKK